MAIKVEDRTEQLLAKGDRLNYSALGTEERQDKIAIDIEDTAIIRPWAGIYRQNHTTIRLVALENV
jgi:hypothetical protein